MDNAELLLRIAAWQACSCVHPLTCGTDSNHPLLQGSEIDNKVALVCVTCGYTQWTIPALPTPEQIQQHAQRVKELFQDE